jgi:hypothetical protein
MKIKKNKVGTANTRYRQCCKQLKNNYELLNKHLNKVKLIHD